MTTMIEKETIGVRENTESLENTQKDLRHFLALDYPIELVKDEDAYVASHPDLPGCVSFGDDPNAAVERLQGVKKLWIEGQLASGNAIPEPTLDDQFSGKFVLRIPKGLHRLADVRARHEGVSLNAFLSNIVAGALGYGRPKPHFDWSESIADRVIETSGSCKIVPWVSASFDWGGRHQRTFKANTNRLQSEFVGALARKLLTHQISTFEPDQSGEEYFRAKERQVRHKSSRGL